MTECTLAGSGLELLVLGRTWFDELERREVDDSRFDGESPMASASLCPDLMHRPLPLIRVSQRCAAQGGGQSRFAHARQLADSFEEFDCMQVVGPARGIGERDRGGVC